MLHDVPHFCRGCYNLARSIPLLFIRYNGRRKPGAAAQRSLANFLSENRQDREAEFWRQRAAESESKLEEYDAEMHGGLAAVQDLVNIAIRSGRIELDAE